MNSLEEIFRKANELFQNILAGNKPEGYVGFSDWSRDYENINTSKAWNKMWFAMNSRFIYFATSAAAIFVISLFLFFSGNEDLEYNILAEQIYPVSENIYLRTSSGKVINIDSVALEDSLPVGVLLDKDKIVYNLQLNEKINSAGLNTNLTGLYVEYNELYIPKGRIYCLVLSDGTKVWLNSESRISYPLSFVGNAREVTLSGEAYFDVVKDDRSFYVNTNQYKIKVLGTKFNVKAYDNDSNTSTTLLEGSVLLSQDNSIEYQLSPGEQFLMDKGNKNVTISNVDVSYFIGWMNNQLKIDNCTLEEIFKVLMRKYDIDTFFSDENAKYEQFSGDLPLNDNLGVILSQLSKVSDVEFQKEGKLIVIRYK